MQDQNLSSQYRVLIADDHKLFRNGLVATLRLIKSVAHIEQAADGMEVMEILNKQATAIDIIFMDINMPGKDGIETTHEVRLNYPRVKVIALSMHDDQKHVIEMMEAGASAYLLKSTNKAEIATAIKEVMEGNQFYGKGVANTILDERLENFRQRANADLEAQLLPKEIEVLEMLYREFSTKEIAERLQLSYRTVEGYRQSLFQKTKTQNLTGLIKFAIRNGYTGGI